MDFDLDDRQRTLLDRVERVVTASGRDRAYDVSVVNGYDSDLDAALRAALPPEPSALGLLDRVLLADRLGELGVATTVGLALAAGAAMDAALPPREAAYTGTPRAVAVAAQYAQQTAVALTTELVQLGGARSFAREFGMHVHTMRLAALRLELGAPHRLASGLNATPYPSGAGNGR